MLNRMKYHNEYGLLFQIELSITGETCLCGEEQNDDNQHFPLPA